MRTFVLLLFASQAALSADYAGRLAGASEGGDLGSPAQDASVQGVTDDPANSTDGPSVAAPGTDAAHNPTSSPVSLRDAIAAYKAGGGEIVGVKDMTITTHMLRDHGWTSEQLDGLTSDELFYLHGMQHAGLISPDGEPVSHEDNEDGYPVVRENGQIAWYVNGQRWAQTDNSRLTDGMTFSYNGRAMFVYRNGSMYDAGSAPQAAATRKSSQDQWLTGTQIYMATAPWCGPCKTSHKDIVPKLEANGWTVIDMDADTEKAFMSAFNIQSLPTWIVVRDGKVVKRTTGASMPTQEKP